MVMYLYIFFCKVRYKWLMYISSILKICNNQTHPKRSIYGHKGQKKGFTVYFSKNDNPTSQNTFYNFNCPLKCKFKIRLLKGLYTRFSKLHSIFLYVFSLRKAYFEIDSTPQIGCHFTNNLMKFWKSCEQTFEDWYFQNT